MTDHCESVTGTIKDIDSQGIVPRQRERIAEKIDTIPRREISPITQPPLIVDSTTMSTRETSVEDNPTTLSHRSREGKVGRKTNTNNSNPMTRRHRPTCGVGNS